MSDGQVLCCSTIGWWTVTSPEALGCRVSSEILLPLPPDILRVE